MKPSEAHSSLLSVQKIASLQEDRHLRRDASEGAPKSSKLFEALHDFHTEGKKFAILASLQALKLLSLSTDVRPAMQYLLDARKQLICIIKLTRYAVSICVLILPAQACFGPACSEGCTVVMIPPDARLVRFAM